MEGVVKELKRRNLVSEECASILENTYAGGPKEIMKRIVLQKKKKNPGAIEVLLLKSIQICLQKL